MYRLCCALPYNVRAAGDVYYLTSDNVHSKQAANCEWHGPVSVLSQNGWQLLIKRG